MINSELNGAEESVGTPAFIAKVTHLPANPIVTIHDMRQALNVLRITAGNIGVRLKPVLDAADRAYLDRRLGVIDDQVQALAAMAEVVCAMANGSTQSSE